MSLEKKTELGDVKISDQVIANIITKTMSAADYNEKIWPATLKGRQIGVLPKIVDAEFASNIIVELDDNDTVILEFSVITRFGVSIRRITRRLSDQIHDDIKYSLGLNASMITINIAGVKSRHIARRNTKAVYKYEAV